MSEFNDERMPALLHPISPDDYDGELSGIDWDCDRERGTEHIKGLPSDYPGIMEWFGIRRWFAKRRNRKRVSANAVLIARTMGRKYASWEKRKEITNWRDPVEVLPPIPPMSGHIYTDDFIAITTDDTILGPAVSVESCETGYWQDVFSCNNVGKIYRFNDGEWVEYLAEMAKEIRSKMWREHDAKWQPLNKAKNE